MTDAIKNTQAIETFLLAVVKAGQQAEADGHVDVADIAYLLPALTLLPAAIAALGGVGAELATLPEHIDEVVAPLEAALGITSPKTKTYLDEGVKILKSAYTIVKTVTSA